jgi:hypothetical protein
VKRHRQPSSSTRPLRTRGAVTSSVPDPIVSFLGLVASLTDNERMIVLVTIIAVSVEVAVDFNFTFAVQHPLRSGQAELVESAPRFLIVPFGMDLDYILHRWPQRPRLIGFQTEEYAACFRFSIHNFRL